MFGDVDAVCVGVTGAFEKMAHQCTVARSCKKNLDSSVTPLALPSALTSSPPSASRTTLIPEVRVGSMRHALVVAYGRARNSARVFPQTRAADNGANNKTCEVRFLGLRRRPVATGHLQKEQAETLPETTNVHLHVREPCHSHTCTCTGNQNPKTCGPGTPETALSRPGAGPVASPDRRPRRHRRPPVAAPPQRPRAAQPPSAPRPEVPPAASAAACR